MHSQAAQWIKHVKTKFPFHFIGKDVLDIGSLDVNGNNKIIFINCSYTGVDIAPGLNVDRVCAGHEVDDPDGTYDTIISTECFEHDLHFPETLKNCVRLLKKNGLFVWTAAGPNRAEHGTRRTSPANSPPTQSDEEWADYYRNITKEWVNEIIDLSEVFLMHEIRYERDNMDTYFYGLKR